MLRKIEPDEFRRLFKEHIKKDFPPSEYPPAFIMQRNLKSGAYDAYFSLDGDGEPQAYAINVNESGGYVLLLLYAVMRGRRGGGIGSGFLGELAGMYADRSGIIAEVERPELAKDDEESTTRERRIVFYERLGFEMVPEIDYTIFGVPMHLMVKPLAKAMPSPRELIDIMHSCYGGVPSYAMKAFLK